MKAVKVMSNPNNNGNNTNLPDDSTSATMQTDTNNGSTENSAGHKASPEDTQTGNEPFERVIESQNKTIDVLMQQIDSLNSQISSLVRSTGSKSDDTTYNPAIDPDVNVRALPEDYTYLKDLGKEIGKRDR